MRTRLLLALACFLAMPGLTVGAERVCEQSESTVTVSPQGRWAASVQHQVCDTGAGVAAAVTVYVGQAAAPLRGSRVVAIAVPRTREEWPRTHWRGESALEVWVPNLATVLETGSGHEDVTVVLKYCGDDPQERARVARHETDMQQWMQAVSRWAEQRKIDPEDAGPRPQEPGARPRPCTDRDIPAVP